MGFYFPHVGLCKAWRFAAAAPRHVPACKRWSLVFWPAPSVLFCGVWFQDLSVPTCGLFVVGVRWVWASIGADVGGMTASPLCPSPRPCAGALPLPFFFCACVSCLQYGVAGLGACLPWGMPACQVLCPCAAGVACKEVWLVSSQVISVSSPHPSVHWVHCLNTCCTCDPVLPYTVGKSRGP